MNDSATGARVGQVESQVQGRDLEMQVERRVRQIEAHVRARPIVTVALAVMSGYLIGRMFRD